MFDFFLVLACSNMTFVLSARDPNQVFTLLESIYGSFDQLARRRKVFKVETIGDCYVAATGLPEPREDHAVAMVNFARDILYEMSVIVVELETLLGPGTADLTIRVGVSSL
jgi:class 3 adenylate cyclase